MAYRNTRHRRTVGFDACRSSLGENVAPTSADSSSNGLGLVEVGRSGARLIEYHHLGKLSSGRGEYPDIPISPVRG